MWASAVPARQLAALLEEESPLAQVERMEARQKAQRGGQSGSKPRL
jgi:hypothetical protein